MDTEENEDILQNESDPLEDTHDETPLPVNRPDEATLCGTPKEPILTLQSRGSQTDPPPAFETVQDVFQNDNGELDQQREESQGEEEDVDGDDEEDEDEEKEEEENKDDEDDDNGDVVDGDNLPEDIAGEVEEKIDHFPQIVKNFTETGTDSEISLQVPKVTITERIRNLSSTSQSSLKFWQNPQNSELRGQLNSTRLHPKCFSQLHLENISRKLTKGRYEQDKTTSPEGVKTLIFWSHDRRRPSDKTTFENTSQVWSARLNMHTRLGKPVHNLEAIHRNSHGTPKRTRTSNICQCLRFMDHHNTCPQSNRQTPQTAKYKGKRFFQTEIQEDGENIDTDSFIRKMEILNSNSETNGIFTFSPRNNTPVGPLNKQHHPKLSVRRELSVPILSGYRPDRIHPHLVKSMDSFHSLSSPPGPQNPTSAPHSLSRQPHHVPSLLNHRLRRQTPHNTKGFDGVIQGANNFTYTDF